MKELILLVGPPGSGKSTLAKTYTEHCCNVDNEYMHINQDSQGREGHMRYFLQAIADEQDIVIDRMNFNKEQRERYLKPAKANGYVTKIIVLHQPQAVCLERMLKREGHPTIQDEKSARGALHTFFTKYQRPESDEADEIEFFYPEGYKPLALCYDLDGTVCDVSHRQHLVQKKAGMKPDWKAFFAGMSEDTVNHSVAHIICAYNEIGYPVIACSGRPSEYRETTIDWLKYNNIPFDNLFMRLKGDHRDDSIVKEVILDFELKTRYNILFVLDDRNRVVKMWRNRGLICLQVAEGDF